MREKDNKERPLILVGPDGRSLHLQEKYQDPRQWQTLETKDVVMMVARPENKSGKRDVLETITCYVEDHLGERITLRTAAEHCNVSVSTITQMFQKRTGMTFHNYLTNRRMQMAEQMIRSGVPMERINRQVGYTDYSSFYRAFCQTFGVSPREFKRNL